MGTVSHLYLFVPPPRSSNRDRKTLRVFPFHRPVSLFPFSHAVP